MERKETIRSAYRMTGGNNFYDGMITCSTQSGARSYVTKQSCKNQFYSELTTPLPDKMQILRFLPLPVMRLALKTSFQSNFGDVFMYRHAIKAPDEMRQLHEQFYAYLSESESRKG